MTLVEYSNAVLSDEDYTPRRDDSWSSSSPLPEGLPGRLRPPGLIRVKRSQRQSAAWLEDVIDAMKRVLALPDGWNSYGSARIKLPAVHNALKVLVVSGFDGPAPTVVPTVRGGVQLEWETEDLGVEVEFDPDGTITTLVEDEQGTREESSTSLLNPFLVETLNRVMQSPATSRQQ
ncbi:MAG: hypothetical protein ACRDYA_14190 [Egibacteraceae bacterium]